MPETRVHPRLRRATAFGLEIVGFGIRDVIPPGEMKTILNRVTEAKKAAEAELITRREETAAMRSQANTARIFESNTALMRLRELEVLEKVAVLASRSKYRAEVVPKEAEPASRPSCAVGTCVPRSEETVHPRSSGLESSHRDAPQLVARSESPQRARPSPAFTSTTASVSTVDRASVTTRTSRPSRYYSWSELMQRVFEIDVLRCPRCEATPMRILAAIHPPTTTRTILRSLGLPTRAPPIAPARPVSPDWTMAEPSAKRAHSSNYGSRPAA